MTRIELHNSASWQDYDNLHRQMEAVGFSRKILGNDGVWYKLPSAEYNLSTTLTYEQVRDLAKGCADMIAKPNSVLVCEYTNAAWSNLVRV
ncbi:MAG TPA: hypothetical protein VGU65_12610 [Frateuria sp.]|uniref:hypothetical protein n=1 Tax=Frateuria sp. TaxID=2211372 RepID=UPI002DE80E58|nr:hypothetical protein [Frateuria sp.]